MIDGLELANEPEVYETRTDPVDRTNIPFSEGANYTTHAFPAHFESRANTLRYALRNYERPVSNITTLNVNNVVRARALRSKFATVTTME